MYHDGLSKAFLASSLAFRALASEGLDSPALPILPPFVPPAAAAALALAAFAAATTLSMFPPLGLLLLGPFTLAVAAAAGGIGFSFSIRFRKGLGRFSSSEKSYSGAVGDASMGIVADLFIVGAAEEEDVVATAADEARFEANGAAPDKSPVGSEVEAGGFVRCRDRRIEGLRRRVAGAAAKVADEELELDEEELLDSRCVETGSALCIKGEGGGPSASDSPSSPKPSPPSSKSNIFAKLSPSLGELAKMFVISPGAGVASVSPVAVRTTPFIADNW